MIIVMGDMWDQEGNIIKDVLSPKFKKRGSIRFTCKKLETETKQDESVEFSDFFENYRENIKIVKILKNL